MTVDQITGVVRAILAALGGFILAKGWVSAETWSWIVGGVATIIPVVWTFVANRPASIAASAQKIDGVNVQVSGAATPAVAEAVAAAKAA